MSHHWQCRFLSKGLVEAGLKFIRVVCRDVDIDKLTVAFSGSILEGDGASGNFEKRPPRFGYVLDRASKNFHPIESELAGILFN